MGEDSPERHARHPASRGRADAPEQREEMVLASDPFEDAGGPDPLDAWLDALEHLAMRAPDALAAESGRPAPPVRAPTPIRRPGPPVGPGATREAERAHRLADVEIAPELRALARVVGDDPARRLSALAARLAAGVGSYDRFGLSAASLRQAFPLFLALYRGWFRVRSEGHEQLPIDGPMVLAGNHGGLLPFDGAMTVMDLLLHSDPPRLLRTIVDRWAGGLPWVNVFFARVGQVVGTHENFARLLDDGEAVLVFPEGIEGIRKPITQRYCVQHFHTGFVGHALRARAPIVPVAILGSDDQAPILFDVKPLARWLRLPTAPITPTFPWFGPLGLLPYPVRYRIVYGAPMRFHERYGADAAGDPETVQGLAAEVRCAVQGLIDRHR